MNAFAMVPTYNESENIGKLIPALLKIPGLRIVVVDDQSPDGTGDIVRKIAAKNKRVMLLARTGARGRGVAGADGFSYCLAKGAEAIIEMDADFSHDPKYIPKMLASLKSCDMVLGSRYAPGGKQVKRPINRVLLTFFANLYIRIVLGVRVHDCNSGFRAFRRDALKKIMNTPLQASGPDIVQEVLYRAHLRRLRICEIPITFSERLHGTSKLGLKHLWRGYTTVLKLRWQHLIGKI